MSTEIVLNLRIGPTVYLIHFAEPIGDLDNPHGQAQHYLGSTRDVFGRMGAFRAGCGNSRIMEVIRERGIPWELVRVWHCRTEAEARSLERVIKKWKNHPRLCPVCRINGHGRKDNHDHVN